MSIICFKYGSMSKRPFVIFAAITLGCIPYMVSCQKQEKALPLLPDKQQPDTGKYSLVFEDDFSGNLDKWNIWTGGAYNDELQCYREDNLKLQNGMLAINARKEKVTGPEIPGSADSKSFNYTSGRIESKFEFSPALYPNGIRISAGIKLAPGYGMWPAFWTYGEPWPTHGEIDILEATGDGQSYTTDYFYGKKPGKVQTNDDLTVKTIVSTTNLTKDAHLYEVEWTQNSLTYYLDGKVVDRKLSTDPGGEYIPSFYNQLQHVALNLAVGGNMFGPDFDPSRIETGSMYVDWVRVYKIR